MNNRIPFALWRKASRQTLNRVPSPLLARVVPWASVMLGSMLPGWFVIGSAPVLPPMGLLVLIAWIQLRPGLLPAWAGLPLGLFDDLFSGQPVGSAVFAWSIAVIVLDVIEARLPWRNFVMETLVAAGLISAYILLTLGFANVSGGSTPVLVVLPQIGLSVLIYPLICRFVAILDRARLVPFLEIR